MHGVFDGRALGQEKGFEVWEELGYYKGTAAFWQRVLEIKDEQASTSSKKKWVIEGRCMTTFGGRFNSR